MKLKNVIEFKNGKKRPKSEGNIPVYGGNGILGYTDEFNSDNKSIIIGRVGAYCGSVYKCDSKCWISDNAIVGKVKNSNDYFYMYYLLKSMNINNYHIGTSQPLMTQEILNNLEANILSYPEQVKVGSILHTIDNKIDLNTQINNNLYEIASRLISNDFENNTETELLNNVINFKKGKKPLDIGNRIEKDYIKYLTIACLNNQEITYANPIKTIISDNDILMVMDGASSGEVYFSDYGIVGSTLARVDITNEKYIKEYIFFILKKYAELIKNKNTGSAIPHTDKAFVKTLELPIISIEQQLKYKNILRKIQHNNIENDYLSQIIDTLLPKLMNGEIDLDKIEI